MSKFYFIPTVYNPNTAATNRCLAYIKGLSELGVDTVVVNFYPNEKRDLMSINLPHIRIVNYWRKFYLPWKLCYLSLMIYYLLFYFRLRRGDVVYCYEQVNVWKLFLKKGVRVYSEYTENPTVIGLGGFFFRTSWKAFQKHCLKLTGVFVISSALKQWFLERGMEDNKVHIINMIVDQSRFENLEDNKDVPPYLAYCGTAYNNKDGVDELLKAFALVVKQYPQLLLYIIGETPLEEDKSGNLQLIKDLGIERNVVFTGIIEAKRMPQLLRDAKVLVLDRPDNIQAKYGFPTKLGEYLLTGNPVVVTQVGDIPRILEDGVSVLFAKPSCPEDFSNKVIWALENPEDAAVIGKRGKEIALKQFNYLEETRKLVSRMCL